MELRLMSTAVLFNGNDLLMMKRAETRALSPGMWAAVGGHVEPGEINEPMEACYREIEEETGFVRSEIAGLTLRYVLLRRMGGEIRQQMFYFGRTLRRDVIQTEEGVLYWIPRETIFHRDIPYVYRLLLMHYFDHDQAPHAWVGTVGFMGESGFPAVQWSPLDDANKS